MLRPPRSPHAQTPVPHPDSRGRSTASPVLSRPLCSNAKTTAPPASYPALVLCEYRSDRSFTFDFRITFTVESLLHYIWYKNSIYCGIPAPLHLFITFILLFFFVDCMIFTGLCNKYKLNSINCWRCKCMGKGYKQNPRCQWNKCKWFHCN